MGGERRLIFKGWRGAEYRKNIVLALLRFVLLLFLCALLLLFFRRERLEMSWKPMVEIG